ncbi:MAG: alpha/beta fold hydrolase [Caulobacter sp.]|nr:alpha/beta fold hydrolase [Caulobacter sp.]
MGRWRLFLAGWVMILAGAWLAATIQTSGGVAVRDVRFISDSGVTLSGLLYVPRTATEAAPAPGILAVHGYINSRETQSPFAIEFARRGYVVLALDQTGHGYSGGAAFSQGFGGPDGLTYLRSLPMVDKANIGLEGHSMGGWTVLAAAAAMPDAYKAVVLEGSSTGAPFAAEGTPAWPRNLALVFSRYDEFSKLMWGVDRAQDVAGSGKLKTVFGTTADVVPGRVYGAIAEGTGRRLTQPVTTHPGDHLSTAAVGDAVDWFGKTLVGGTPRPAGDQIWMWKEVGTGVALIGFVVLLLGTFELLIGLPLFAGLKHPPAPAVERRTLGWWGGLATTAFLPILTFFPAFILVTLKVPPSALLPQTITTQVIVWALINAVLTLGLGWLSRKRPMAAFDNRWLRGGLIALATVAMGYLSLVVVDLLFKVDFRFWVVALKLFSPKQALIALVYVLPFIAVFLVSTRALHGRLSVGGDGAVKQYVSAVAALALGFLVLLAVDYGVFFATGRLPTDFDPLTTVVAIQFLPLMAMVALISTFTWRRTGSYVPGAVISGLVVTWYVVAGTATQGV